MASSTLPPSHVHSVPPAALEEIVDRFNAFIQPTLVPIFSEQAGYKLVGTGSLLRIADTTLLVTAYHVLELNLRHELPLWIGRGEGEPNARLIAGETVSIVDDETDIGILRLTDEVAHDVLGPGRLRALRWPQLLGERASKAPDGCYVMCGFPWEVTGQQPDGALHPTSLCISTSLFDGDRSTLESRFNPALHYLFRFDEGKARNLRTGESDMIPKPDGMSGSVVWRIGRADIGIDPESWTPDQTAAVGIFTGWYPSLRALKATSMAAVIDLIRRSFADLRPALKLLLPPPPRPR